jgi:hypothetical protein
LILLEFERIGVGGYAAAALGIFFIQRFLQVEAYGTIIMCLPDN